MYFCRRTPKYLEQHALLPTLRNGWSSAFLSTCGPLYQWFMMARGTSQLLSSLSFAHIFHLDLHALINKHLTAKWIQFNIMIMEEHWQFSTSRSTRGWNGEICSEECERQLRTRIEGRWPLPFVLISTKSYYSTDYTHSLVFLEFKLLHQADTPFIKPLIEKLSARRPLSPPSSSIHAALPKTPKQDCPCRLHRSSPLDVGLRVIVVKSW